MALALASGTGLLLAANVACINLVAKLMFLCRGAQPRTWLDKSKARQSVLISAVFWVVVLALLVASIILRRLVQN